jgi:error-prone DNA polymerase
MSHFDPGKQMQTLKERFIAGAHTRHEVPVEIAERVWEMMSAFAGYGFPKAHAASYAQVAWRSAWCKAHFPATFMASVMANWGGYYSQRVYMTEARRLGLSIRPPHINYSRLEFSVAEIDNTPVLFMGLDQVRELTRRTQNRILQQRPFHSLQDFIKRADPKPIELENLIKVSALEGLGTIPVLLYEMSHPKISSNQLLLFSMDYDTITTSTSLDDWSTEEKVSAQEAILGTGVIAHPLELLSSKITGVGSLSTVSAASRIGDSVIVAGMRQTWRRSRTYRGEYIYFLALEDLEGILDVIISQNVYQRYRSELSNQGPYVIEGVVENDPTTLESILRAERIVNLTK